VKAYNSSIATYENVEMVLVSADRSEAAALKWASKEKFPWPHVLAGSKGYTDLQKMAKNYVPYYLLVDGSGKKIAEGAEAVFTEVAKLGVKAKAPAGAAKPTT